MLHRLSRLFKRNRDPERTREDAESSLRAQQELRQAEEAKSQDRQALEGIQKSFPRL
jgi:hypothetical protein